MTPLFAGGLLILAVAQLMLPKRFGLLPLLIAACHFPNVSILGVGGYDFSITRLIIGLGLIRACIGRDLKGLLKHPLDWAILVWSFIALLTSFAHNSDDGNPLVFSMGLVYNVAGAYLCARAYLKNTESIFLFAKCLGIVLLPLAFLMLVEKVTQRDFYSVMGGVAPDAMIREGSVRARGPFVHPILAGTAGASSLFLMLVLWKRDRRAAIVGAGACVLITLASASSGPIMTLMSGSVACMLWRWRTKLRNVRRGVLLALIVLHMVMKAPVWYLIARMDIVGGSTGWHRAELINAGIVHVDEWWFAGTDYTVHWMPTGASWSPNHTDITNHYLQMGVMGGFPLMFGFIGILVVGFKTLGRRMAELRSRKNSEELALWFVGGNLFAHSVTFLSVSYFDQINVLFCVVVGSLPGLCARDSKAMRAAPLRQEKSMIGEEYPLTA
jgi:hypothetical protein